MDFTHLTESILNLDSSLRKTAIGTVNRMHTMRNWLIGFYIVEYEQKGEDRAKYGSVILLELSAKLRGKGVKGFSNTNLKLFRQFYLEYPYLCTALLMQKGLIGQAPTDQFLVEVTKVLQQITMQTGNTESNPKIGQKPSDQFYLVENECVTGNTRHSETLILHFSFSHFVELMRISDPLKRTFYEIEGIKGAWSVPQLKRQIESLLYERTGMSKDKAGLVEAVHAEKRINTIEDMIRDPYILEFTGFPEHYQFSEADLETSLLDHIQSFLLELGNGFCFEASVQRQLLLRGDDSYK
jgi:predicted nuclease of restriction endonuclease-like (RecB) superfamily